MSDTEKTYSEISQFLVNMGAKEISIFGSYSRGDNNNKSDIDILVEFHQRKSLLELIALEQSLTEMIGIKVDLLTKKSVSPYLIDKILKERVIIYQ